MPLINSKRAERAVTHMGSGAHAASRKNEGALMKRLGGTVTPRSGAGPKKGDGQIKGLARIEVKGTTKASFSVTKAQLCKNDMAGLSAGEYPIMVVQFLDAMGKVEDEQAVIRLSDLEDLLRRCQ